MLAATDTAILIVATAAIAGIAALLVGGALARPSRVRDGGLPYWLRLLIAVLCALVGFCALAIAFVLGMCAWGGWGMH